MNIRAPIGNKARADAALAIHADGGPPGGYGFAKLVPELVHTASTDNGPIIGPSHRLADAMVRHFAAVTGQNVSTYLGSGGIQSPQRPRRAEPVHGSQGLHRMREHAQRTRRREGHQRALAAARRPGHRRFDQRLPRRQVTTGPPIRPRQPAARGSRNVRYAATSTSPSFTWKAPGWSILLPSLAAPRPQPSASGPYRETTTDHP